MIFTITSMISGLAVFASPKDLMLKEQILRAEAPVKARTSRMEWSSMLEDCVYES